MTALSSADDALRGRLALVHSALLLCVILWRPLIAMPDHRGLDHLLWHVLILVGYGVLALEFLRGWRQEIYWGWAGLVGVVAIVTLIPGFLRAFDPASGMGFALSTAGQVLFAGYLVQVVRGREALMIASLTTALVMQGLVAWAQQWWVLPQMSQLQDTGALGLSDHSRLAADLRERIANGGVYTTFTVANGLGVALLAGVWLVVGFMVAAKRSHPWALGPLALAAVVLVGGLYYTDSKGAWLLAGITMAIALGSHVQVRVRWLMLGIAVGALINFLWLWPVMDIPSVKVRSGYFMAALRLAGEAPLWGHGWEAFANESPRVLPLWGEYTRRVHNEVLEALVAAGAWAAIAVAAFLGVCLRPPASQPPAAATPVPRPGWLPWLAGPLILYAVVLGTLDSDNLSLWPGGDQLGGLLLWGAVLGLVAATILRGLLALPTPKTLFAWLGLVAIIIGCTIDFHLHHHSLIALIVILASGPHLRHIRLPRQRRPLLALVSVLIMLIAGGVIARAQHRAEQLELATLINQQLTTISSITNNQVDWEPLRQLLGGAQLGRAEMWEQARRRQWALAANWPASEPLVRAARKHIRDPNQRLQALTSHLQTYADSTAIYTALARTHAELQQWPAAISRQQQAVHHNPWNLPLRQTLIYYAQQAQQRSSPPDPTWQTIIDEQRQHIEELNPQVFGRHRVR